MGNAKGLFPHRLLSAKFSPARRVASHLRTNGPARKQERTREDKAHPVALLTAYGKEKKQIIPRPAETCENS